MGKPSSELYRQFEIEIKQYKSENFVMIVHAKNMDDLYRMFGDNLECAEELPFTCTDRSHLKCPKHITYVHGFSKTLVKGEL